MRLDGNKDDMPARSNQLSLEMRPFESEEQSSFRLPHPWFGIG
jgi:hypothetical protein